MEIPMPENDSKLIGNVARAIADNRIVIIVEGGVVQDVFGIPKGYGLEVHDYDVEGCDEGDLETNDDGDKFYRGVWAEPDARTNLLALCDAAQSVCDEAADWISGDESYDPEVVASSLRKMANDVRAALGNN
jgi:hypothetical protein